MHKAAMLLMISLMLFLHNAEAFHEDDVIFKLYKHDNPTNYSVLKVHESNGSRSIANEHFDADLPTRIVIHGFLGDADTIDRYRRAYLNFGEYNFIVVDWIEGAFTWNYYLAKHRVKHVASILASLIDALRMDGMNLSDLTLIGHSLGAHIAGRAAKKLKSNEKIGIIIGLDPASVGFDFADVEQRLSHLDAEYVQVIHTDIEKFGMAEPIGHVDIYANAGKLQPGCVDRSIFTTWFDKCSHHRSHELFWETLTANFTAIKCASFDELMQNRCTFDNATTIMGGDIVRNPITRPNGIFYLETNANAPFVIPEWKSFSKIKIIYESNERSAPYVSELTELTINL